MPALCVTSGHADVEPLGRQEFIVVLPVSLRARDLWQTSHSSAGDVSL